MFASRTIISLSLLFATSALAQDTEIMSERRARDQMAMDLTQIPDGQGALFVPALTETKLEPGFVVFNESGAMVTRGEMGRRVAVAPGRYFVTVDQGQEAARPKSKMVDVAAGETTVIPPFYAAIQIDATDRRGRPKTAEYNIREVATAQGAADNYAGKTGFEPAARTQAWLVNPGRYKLGLGKKSKQDASSVALSVHSGELLRYRLVADGDELIRTELADADPVVRTSPWRTRWRLGADVAFHSSRDQIASFNGTALQLGGFSDMSIQFDRGVHLARLDFRVGEAWLGVNNQIGSGLPLQKLLDRAELGIGYDLRLWRFVGPYFRATARTSFFDTLLYVSNDSTIVETMDNGESQLTQVNAKDSFKLTSFLAPLVFQESAGLSATFIDTEVISFVLRGGPAVRHSFYRGGQYVKDKRGDTIEVESLVDYAGFGAAASASLQLRINEALWIDSELDGYLDRRQIFDGAGFEPVYRWDNRVNLSFNRSVSLAYDFAVERPEFGVDRTALIHLLSLRAHVSIF